MGKKKKKKKIRKRKRKRSRKKKTYEEIFPKENVKFALKFNYDEKKFSCHNLRMIMPGMA